MSNNEGFSNPSFKIASYFQLQRSIFRVRHSTFSFCRIHLPNFCLPCLLKLFGISPVKVLNTMVGVLGSHCDPVTVAQFEKVPGRGVSVFPQQSDVSGIVFMIIAETSQTLVIQMIRRHPGYDPARWDKSLDFHTHRVVFTTPAKKPLVESTQGVIDRAANEKQPSAETDKLTDAFAVGCLPESRRCETIAGIQELIGLLRGKIDQATIGFYRLRLRTARRNALGQCVLSGDDNIRIAQSKHFAVCMPETDIERLRLIEKAIVARKNVDATWRQQHWIEPRFCVLFHDDYLYLALLMSQPTQNSMEICKSPVTVPTFTLADGCDGGFGTKWNDV
jgi:hypothetical protein